MEVVELHAGHSSPDPGGDGLTGISHEVRDTEQLGRLSCVSRVLTLKMPEEQQQQSLL